MRELKTYLLLYYKRVFSLISMIASIDGGLGIETPMIRKEKLRHVGTNQSYNIKKTHTHDIILKATKQNPTDATRIDNTL